MIDHFNRILITSNNKYKINIYSHNKIRKISKVFISNYGPTNTFKMLIFQLKDLVTSNKNNKFSLDLFYFELAI